MSSKNARLFASISLNVSNSGNSSAAYPPESGIETRLSISTSTSRVGLRQNRNSSLFFRHFASLSHLGTGTNLLSTAPVVRYRFITLPPSGGRAGCESPVCRFRYCRRAASGVSAHNAYLSSLFGFPYVHRECRFTVSHLILAQFGGGDKPKISFLHSTVLSSSPHPVRVTDRPNCSAVPAVAKRSSEKVSGSGWGGIPQRTQRCIGRGEKGLTSAPFSTFVLVC